MADQPPEREYCAQCDFSADTLTELSAHFRQVHPELLYRPSVGIGVGVHPALSHTFPDHIDKDGNGVTKRQWCATQDIEGCSGKGRPSCTTMECMYGVEPCGGGHFKSRGAATCSFIGCRCRGPQQGASGPTALHTRIASMKKHMCSSCDMDDEERARNGGWNAAIDAVVAILPVDASDQRERQWRGLYVNLKFYVENAPPQIRDLGLQEVLQTFKTMIEDSSR